MEKLKLRNEKCKFQAKIRITLKSAIEFLHHAMKLSHLFKGLNCEGGFTLPIGRGTFG